MIIRYQFEKELEPLDDNDLHDRAKLYDQHFTYAQIPTNRIKEAYLEAMRHHGQYLLKVDDFIRAWDRIRPQEGAGVDTRLMGARGESCTICKGTGRTKVYLPLEGIEVEKECPYHCDVVTALAVRGAK